MKLIKEQKIRKFAPKHLGRKTEEERAEIERRQRIHVPRELRKMLVQYGTPISDVEMTVKCLKHFLMDVAHDRREKNELDEQATIERVIALID